MDLGLDGTRALVLAASKGLGRASATELVREGARTVISSSDPDNLAVAEEAIRSATGVGEERIDSIVIDLEDPDSVRSGVERAIDHLGGLDVLVTNRGGPPERSFEESSIADFDAVFQSVLRSSLIAIKTAMPALLEDDGGAITNIVATSVREPQSNHVLANTVRPGIYGLSKSLSEEYGPKGLRVNCVTPRGVETDRTRSRRDRFGRLGETITREEAEERGILRLIGDASDHALERWADPEEFGRVVAFVSSDAASYMTGSVVDVDGGWSRHIF